MHTLRPRPQFEYARAYELANGQILIGSYHPSRQNTNTGKLTPLMIDQPFRLAVQARLRRSPL
jgi:uracil-DNA glycosylase